MISEKSLSATHYLSPDYIKFRVLPYYNLENSDVLVIKFKDSDKQRAVYKISHKNNMYCLKKVYYNTEDLLYVYSAIEWCYQNNINVPRLIPTIYNSRFISINNIIYILTPWIEGEKCNFDNSTHVSLSIRTLAKMHASCTHFYPINGSHVRTAFDDSYISTQKHFNDLLKSSNNAFRCKDSFSKLFLDNFDTNLKLAKISLYMSSKIDPNSLSKSLCHGDFVNKNIIFTDNLVPWIIDFDKCKNDYCAKDLSYFMRRILKRKSTQWNTTLALSILNDYTSIKSLLYNATSKSENQYIFAIDIIDKLNTKFNLI